MSRYLALLPAPEAEWAPLPLEPSAKAGPMRPDGRAVGDRAHRVPPPGRVKKQQMTEYAVDPAEQPS